LPGSKRTHRRGSSHGDDDGLVPSRRPKADYAGDGRARRRWGNRRNDGSWKFSVMLFVTLLK
jgi:hypothetical protein